MNFRRINFILIGLCFTILQIYYIKNSSAEGNTRIKAVGIPLADHYAGIVALEKYKDQMKYADYQLLILPGPHLVAGYFNSEPDADVAFTVSPMVMDMFAQKADFRWVSLIHRDGNALAINDLMNEKVKLPQDKRLRIPDGKIAQAVTEFKKISQTPVSIAIPSPLATHATILYKYLKDQGKTIGFINQENVDVVLDIVKPPKSLAYLKQKTARNLPAAFEQSLPWPDMAEGSTCKCGHVAWYSKDVMNHPNGHVECIIIAKDEVIEKKRQALREVIYYIHQAGRDIETARVKGGQELEEIISMIRKHIPQHSREAIIESLRPDLMVINYKNLNVDRESKNSFREIMNLAFEAGFIKKKIDIEALAEESFSTSITSD